MTEAPRHAAGRFFVLPPLQLAAVTVAFVSVVVMAATVGAEPVWLDEALTVDVVRQDVAAIVRLGEAHEINMLPYYVVMHGWTQLFGDGEVALRLPSVAAMAIAFWLLFLVARRLHGTTVACVAVILASLHAALFQYAQEARGYAFAVALVLGGSWLLISAVEGRRLAWFAHGVVMALATYVHLLVILVTLAHLLAGAIAQRSLRGVARSAAVSAVLLAPLVVLVPRQPSYQWIEPLSVRGVFSAVTLTTGRAGAIGILALGVVAAAGAISRRGRDIANLHDPFIVAVVLGSAIAVSVVKPVIVPRYFVVIVPALVTLVAAGAVRAWRWRPLGGALAGVAVAAVLMYGMVVYVQSDKEAMDQAVEIVATAPNDQLLVEPSFNLPTFRYYADRRGLAPPMSPLALDTTTPRPAPTQVSAATWIVLWRPKDADRFLERLCVDGRWEVPRLTVAHVHPRIDTGC